MKVLFTSRSTLFSQPGGDTQQVLQTAEALRTLGLSVDIILRGEKMNLNEYDLVHFFNLGRPADIVEILPKINCPLVISSIWVDFSEYDKYRPGISGKIQRVIGASAFEGIKNIARGLKGTDMMPGRKFLSHGYNRSLHQLATKAKVIFASSSSEKQRIAKFFDLHESVRVLPLGLSAAFLENFQEEERDGVICVGRIEGLKNQLNLIEAANASSWKLKIVGKPAANQPDYFEDCKQLANQNVEFKGWLDADNLIQEYRTAKVLVLPSYFETFGLVALEAKSQGCNLVIADRPDMNSIFGDCAFLCNPNDASDIKEKVDKALKFSPARFSTEEKKIHNWKTIASNIKSAYEEILTEKS